MDKSFVGLIILFMFGHMLSFAMEGVQGVVTTTLATDVGETAASINVASTTGFPSAGTLIMDDEVLDYTARTATTFTGLTRGVGESDPANHDADSIVYQEAAGVLNMGMDFKVVESSVPLLRPVLTIAHNTKSFTILVGKLIIWDYSWFDDEVLGIPLVYLQYLFYALSIGLVVRLVLLIRGAGVG